MSQETKQLEAMLDGLADSVVTDPQKIQDFIKAWRGGQHNYSFNNTLLIYMQCPKNKLVMGEKQWEKRHKRTLTDKKPIRILAPILKNEVDEKTGEKTKILLGYRVVKVYDISQTDGPEVQMGGKQFVGKNHKLRFGNVERLLRLPGIKIVISDKLGQANGSASPGLTEIAPNWDNEPFMIKNLVHEQAHHLLGHIKNPHNRDIEEVEAEAVTYLVTEFLGIKNEQSALYIGNWAGENSKEIIKGRGRHIMMTANQIVNKLKLIL